MSKQYTLDVKHMNEMQQREFEDFLRLVKHGAKFVDICVRKDGVEYMFEADFLKKVKPSESIGDPDTDYSKYTRPVGPPR